MSKTLLRNMLDAAINGDLTLNEWRVFAVILRQTVGFGKRADPLMDSRISKLSGIRKDRIRHALQGIADKRLFDVAPHKWLDNTYTIPAAFFDGDATPRFFAPSAPLNGETPRAMGDFHHSSGTYRDLPLQRSTSTDTNNDDQPSEPVCDVPVNFNPVTAIKKPEEVDDATYVALIPALRKLPNDKAVDVLALLAVAIRDRSIKTTPEKLGGHFIKCAHLGTLDTSPLRDQQKAADDTAAKAAREAARKAREAAADRAYLIDMAKRAGISPAALGVTA